MLCQIFVFFRNIMFLCDRIGHPVVKPKPVKREPSPVCHVSHVRISFQGHLVPSQTEANQNRSKCLAELIPLSKDISDGDRDGDLQQYIKPTPVSHMVFILYSSS